MQQFRNTILTFLSIFISCLSIELYSQVVYEPLYNDVYSFLRQLSIKGVIEFNDEVRPLPRKHIAEKLVSAEQQVEQLTEVELADLKFFKQDYLFEIGFIEKKEVKKHMEFIGNDPADRWRVFSYADKNFKLNLSPILGYEYGSIENSKATHLWNGVYTFGYITDAVGFSFSFRDNTEEGNKIDKTKSFTPVTGGVERSSENMVAYPENKIEYSETNAIIATDWNWGSFSVGKDFMEWGYAQNGLIVLSRKAPSFPFIRLDISPVDWLGFNYFHGWLASNVIDSTSIYYTDAGSERYLFRPKFIASHTLFIRPTAGLNISIGESIVYSDQLEVLYLIPIMFFRLADHYLSNQDNRAGSNAQFFAALSSRNHIKNTHLYGSLFIDELKIGGLFDKESQRYQLGFTLGASTVDLPLKNLTLTAEYSKVYPFVYDNFNQTQTYTSSSYVLGHWMGNNGDHVFGSIKYRILRGLEASVWGRYIRKGERGTIEDQYKVPQPPFLFGLRSNFTYIGAMVKYQIIHELFVRFRYQYRKSSEQQENIKFIDSNLTEFGFGVYYGL